MNYVRQSKTSRRGLRALSYQNLETRNLLAADILCVSSIADLGHDHDHDHEEVAHAGADVPFGVYTAEEIESFHSYPIDSAWSTKTPTIGGPQFGPFLDGGFTNDANGGDVLTFVLDFKEASQGTTTDITGRTTDAFDITAYGFAQSDFTALTNSILAEVRDDYFDELIGTVAGPPGQDLEIEFIIGDIGTAPSGISEFYFIQIGDGDGNNPLGIAGGSVVRNASGAGPNFGITNGDVVGSVFTEEIIGLGGLTPSDALTGGNINFTTFGIGGTLSHEIGHTLSLSHADKAGSTQPTAGVSPIMGTGAIDLPNQDRITDREFTLSGTNQQAGGAAIMHVQQLVDAIGLHNKSGAVIDTDDQISEAIAASLTSSQTGEIDIDIDVDMWTVFAEAGTFLEIDVDIANQDLDSLLRLFDSAGNELAFSDDDTGIGNEPHNRESFIRYEVPADGNYYFAVSAFDNVDYDPVTGEGDVEGQSNGIYQLFVGIDDADDAISEAVPVAIGSNDGSITFQTDVDMWSLDMLAGQQVTIDIDIVGEDLDSLLRVFDASGTEVDISDDSPGPLPEFHNRESFLVYSAPTTGTYFFGISAYNNVTYNPLTGGDDVAGATTGDYEMIVDLAGPFNATISERQVFYNGSSFDSNDLDAIGTDKVALLPGETATFENYTSYSLGINGLVLETNDFLQAPELANVNDFFQFRMGNDNTPGAWDPAPAPTSVSYQSDVDSDGTDIVVLTWADNAIQNTWLEVTTLSNVTTGLPADDVFYIGNVIGESGNEAANAQVDLIDVALTRSNQTGFTSAAIDNAFDFDRSGGVDLLDVAIARSNQSGFSSVQLITPPVSDNGSNRSGDNGTGDKDSDGDKESGGDSTSSFLRDFSAEPGLASLGTSVFALDGAFEKLDTDSMTSTDGLGLAGSVDGGLATSTETQKVSTELAEETTADSSDDDVLSTGLQSRMVQGPVFR